MIEHLKIEFKNLVGFLKKPEDYKAPNQSFKQRLTKFTQILILNIFLVGCTTLIFSFLQTQGWINVFQNEVVGLPLEMSIWTLILFAIFLIPFIEELIFRYPLRFKSNVLMKLIIWAGSLFGQNTDSKIAWKLKVWWRKRFGLLFYTSALLFSLLHLTNYSDLGGTLFYLIPVLVLPQFIFSLLTGYIRVRYNFVLGYGLHVSNNAILLLTPLLLTGQSTELLHQKMETYSLTIEEVNYGAGRASIGSQEDTLYFENIDLRNVISFLLDKKGEQMESNKPHLLKKHINLQFIDLQDNSLKQNYDTILKKLAKTFKFTLLQTHRMQVVNQLNIVDRAQLRKHISNSITVRHNIRANEINLKNSSLEGLAAVLSSNLDQLVLSDTIEGRFDFNLPMDPRKQEAVLAAKYGIKIIPKTKKVRCMFVKFE